MILLGKSSSVMEKILPSGLAIVTGASPQLIIFIQQKLLSNTLGFKGITHSWEKPQCSAISLASSIRSLESFPVVASPLGSVVGILS